MANTTVKRQYTKLVNDNNDLEIEHFETDADIVLVEKGSGKYQGDATNVQDALKEVYTMAATGGVTGVKGDAESNYRQGNINLTPANIGAVPASDIGYVDLSTTGGTFPKYLNNLTEVSKKYCIINVDNELYYKAATYSITFENDDMQDEYRFVKISEYGSATNANNVLLSNVELYVHTIAEESGTYQGKYKIEKSTNYIDLQAYNTTKTDAMLSGKVDKKPNGTNDLITNNKIAVSYLPDIVLGQLVYGGTVTGAGVATLSTNAKTKLGTSSNSITLTNNTTATTGYAANEGIFYVVSDDGNFASLGLKTGDWLISVGSAWKKIDNTDEVTSVTVAATGPVVSSTATSQTGNVSTTISLADNYGDTKNPYASKTKNYVLAAPSSANGAPSFRALTAADIPNLSLAKIDDLTIIELTGEAGTLTNSEYAHALHELRTLISLNGNLYSYGDDDGTYLIYRSYMLFNNDTKVFDYRYIKINKSSHDWGFEGYYILPYYKPSSGIPSSDLADGAVTTAKIADGNVTSAKLEASGVTAGTYSAVTVNSKGLVTAGAKTIEFGTSGQTTPSASLAIGGIFLKQL